MKFPKHITMRIIHNPHAGTYTPLEKWIEDELASGAAGGWRADEVIRPEDLDEIRRTGEVWQVLWCPDTPVGSRQVIAATLDRALDLAGAEKTAPPIEEVWRALTDDQRLALRASCCRGCGSLDTGCQCWNDD